MKVIFLDVDGVLNDFNTAITNYLQSRRLGYDKLNIDETKVELLKEIVDKTGAKLVLSSSWRGYGKMNNGVFEPRTIGMIEFVDLLKQYDLEIYDVTPMLPSENRGEEINAWLRRHPDVESFIIIDDEDENLQEYKGKELVKTQYNNSDVILEPDYGTGLCRKHVAEAVEKLNSKALKRTY